eukprot:TRINITY_DN506_c0_g1_i7.p1 TRINITY_DN506_c0_g1~~TRINITY_DN506_c0_g1_i7.p1  ORF type:complete len:967 (+),score=365.77 TRINITY_DN506_c0_g1_i7:130-3030(+)
MNFKYLDKRVMYLAHICKELKQHKRFRKMKWSTFAGNPDKPVLLIYPGVNADNIATKFVIRIVPCLEMDAMEFKKLLARRSNVRTDDGESNPTPLYSHGIVEDMLIEEHNEYLNEFLEEDQRDNVVETIMLFKIWLRRRGLGMSRDGINGFTISMLLVYLVKQHKLTKHMSAYQMFKIALKFISETDIQEQGLSLFHVQDHMDEDDGGEHSQLVAQQTMADHLQHFDLVFQDATGHCNLMAKVSKDAYQEFRYEAALSLEFLAHNAITGFNAVFIQTVDPFLKFDTLIWIPETPILGGKKNEDGQDKQEQFMDYDVLYQSRQAVIDTLKRGLNDRVQMLRSVFVHEKRFEEWALNDSSVHFNQEGMLIGMIVDPENVTRTVDRGPAADSDDAQEFRQLWGDKSELRRFRDGTIIEAVVWDVDLGQRDQIVGGIVRYLLYLHFSVQPKAVQLFGNQQPSHQGETMDSLEVTKITDSLGSIIKGLDDLPLMVMNTQPISAVSRYTDIWPQSAYQLEGSQQSSSSSNSSGLKYVRPIELVLQFETSGKWPEDDVAAIVHLKAAFYLQMSSALKKQKSIASSCTAHFIDIAYEGLVFRVFIYHLRELILHSKTNKIEAANAGRQLMDLPKHSSYIHAFHKRNVSYGPTVKLAKRWMHSQLFSGYVREEAIELIVASLYTNPQPYKAPQSALTGFLRFLYLICSFNWAAVPLIVDQDGDIEDESEIIHHFEGMLAAGINPGMFIATPEDKFDSIWTADGPSPLILKRLQGCALVAMDQVKTMVMNTLSGGKMSTNKMWKGIFQPVEEDFDVRITIDPTMVIEPAFNLKSKSKGKAGSTKLQDTLHQSAAHTKYANLKDSVNMLPDVLVGLDPVQCYISDLQMRFGEFALFFYNETCPHTVYVSWKPKAFVAQPFKLVQSSYRFPVDVDMGSGSSSSSSSNKIQSATVPNIFEIVAEFKAVGEGLVDQVMFV